MRFPGIAAWSLTVFASAAVAAHPGVLLSRPPAPIPKAANEDAQRVLEGLPMRFELNQGQIHPDVRYFSRWGDYTLFLTQRQAVLALPNGVLRMSLRNGNPKPLIEGISPLNARTDVFKGNRSESWKRNVPQFKRVAYRGVYPGIDVVYYGAGRLLEHDFLVAPGADPKRIRMRFKGADQLSIDPDGGLVLRVGGAELRQPKPFIYQQPEGSVTRDRVEGKYVLLSKNEVGFELGDYNHSETLVIDPVLMYSSYVGGTSSDVATAMTVDRAGRIWITGQTFSADYPITENNYEFEPKGDADIFVTAIDTSIPGRGSVVYSTFIGGTGIDEARAITTDSAGNIYITGNSGSLDFPHGGNSYSIENKGERDAIIMKLNPLSSGKDILELSTYFGGEKSDYPLAIAVNELNGTIWIAGYTTSGDLALFGDSVQGANRGGYDAFMVNVDPSRQGSQSILYTSYYGGDRTDVASAIKVDAAGNIYFAGYTMSTDFPVLDGAYRTTPAGGGDVFLTKLDFSRQALDQIAFSTLFGGSGFDTASAIGLDSANGVVIAGYTLSTDLPVIGNAAQQSNGGNSDVFVARFDIGANIPTYSTYLGGTGSDIPYGFALDAQGRAWVSGYTSSSNFPVRGDSVQQSFGGAWDGFFARLNVLSGAGDSLTYSSFVGGFQPDTTYGIAVDANGVVYLAGVTNNSTGFPISEGAFAGAHSGYSDGFVIKLTIAE